MDYCPTCKSEIKKGLLSNNQFVEKERIEFINAFTNKNYAIYCNKCANPYSVKARINYKSIKSETEEALKVYINSFPMLTIEPPQDWNYSVLGLVSFSRSVFSDFESRKKGLEICMQALKTKTYNLEGNAIVGTSIGYSMEKQTANNCTQIINVYGTAILVFNTELFSGNFLDAELANKEFEVSRDLIEKYSQIYSILK